MVKACPIADRVHYTEGGEIGNHDYEARSGTQLHEVFTIQVQ